MLPFVHQIYEKIDFSTDGHRSDAGTVGSLPHPDKGQTASFLLLLLLRFYSLTCMMIEETLMRRWRFPSLSLHGIEGAYADKGAKTVIPRKVVGKFSIRLVPDQDPDDIIAKVVPPYMQTRVSSSSSLSL